MSRLASLLRVSASASAGLACARLASSSPGAASLSEPSTSSRARDDVASPPPPSAAPSPPSPPPALDAPVAASYPATASNKSTAQWRVYTDIARDLSGRGELEAAGAYLRRALAEAREGFGAADPHVAAAKNNLAELYRLQRRYEEAEALYAEAAAALERHYGASHPASGVATHNLAGCRLARGDAKGAYDAYAAAARKKRAALGPHHPDYAATLFHAAEAKRACGDGAGAATLLESSLAILERAGQGESSPALRRRERLAQVQGDVLGNHAAAEATRRKVARAREEAVRRCDEGSGEHPARDEHPRGSSSGLRVAALAVTLGALAAALEAHASSLSALGRWDEAIDAMRGAVKARARRVECLGTGGEGGFAGWSRRMMTPDDPSRGAARRAAAAVEAAVEAAADSARTLLAAFFGRADDRSSAIAASSERTSAAVQLAAVRTRLAETISRRRTLLAEEKAFGGAVAEDAEALEALRSAVRETRALAESAAASLARRAGVGGGESEGASPSVADGSPMDGGGDRSVAAGRRRREAAAAPERDAAALVVFSRAARALSALRPGDDRAREDAGDAVEWLLAGFAAAERAGVGEAGRRAIAKEIREVSVARRSSSSALARY